MQTIPSDCVGFEEDLSALLAGELRAAREVEVREHVEQCTRCSDRLRAFERVGESLRGLPVPAAPYDLELRLRARIESDRIERRRVVLGLTPHRRRPSFARVGIAVGVALVLLLGPSMTGDGGGAPVARIAQEPPAPTPAPPPRAVRSPESRRVPQSPERQPAPKAAPQRVATREPRAQRSERPTAQPVPTVARETPPGVDLAGVSEEEIALALELDTVRDFDVIDHLELLELLATLGEPTSSADPERG
jgi:hypothetical protein